MLQEWDDDHGWFVAPNNFAGRVFNFDVSQWPWNEPLGLECEVDLSKASAPMLTITTCGVNGGCHKHACRRLQIPFDSHHLRRILGGSSSESSAKPATLIPPNCPNASCSARAAAWEGNRSVRRITLLRLLATATSLVEQISEAIGPGDHLASVAVQELTERRG